VNVAEPGYLELAEDHRNSNVEKEAKVPPSALIRDTKRRVTRTRVMPAR